MTFDEAFGKLLLREGGFINDRRDAGGATKFGISARSYPKEDIANLTKERAAFLYKRDYWGPCGAESLPDPVRFQVFDMSVNAGVAAAVRALQSAVGVQVDGVLGAQTLQAVNSMPPARVAARFCAARLRAYTNDAGWVSFSRGWVNRVAMNLQDI